MIVSSGLVDDESRQRISQALDETLFVEAGAGSGKTRSLVERIVNLVLAGERVSQLAAITFTEKAATELRDRVRRRLEEVERELSTSDPARAGYVATALDELDGAAVGTLHSFSQRLLNEHPVEAGLPPRIEVHDEVSSEVAFEERWARFVDDLLDAEEHERLLLMAVAAGIDLAALRDLARAFEANWDLVAGRVDLDVPDPPPVDVADLLVELANVCGSADTALDEDDHLVSRLTALSHWGERVTRTTDYGDEAAALALLSNRVSAKVKRTGRKDNWPPGSIDEVRQSVIDWDERCEELQRRTAQALLERFAALLAEFTLAGVDQRVTEGRLEFHDLLVLARRMLRGEHGVEVRRVLRDRYSRLLLDEFQDTDPIQIDLAVLITSSDDDAASRAWNDIRPDPGRLFVVGDPKQSIYRFRRADISLFLEARELLGDPAVPLTTNFRTTPPVIKWVNSVFDKLIQPKDAEDNGQPVYQPLDPAPHRTVPTVGPPVAILGAQQHADDPRAGELREREAEQVASVITTALDEGWTVCDGPDDDGNEHWRPARVGDVTILVPSRLSLPYLEDALDRHSVPYRAETSSLVYATREVRDLLATVRAVDDPTDQLSLVTALRSSIFGCGDDDLFTWRIDHNGRWNHHRRLPESLPDDHPVAAAIRFINELHRERAWLAPSELIERIVRDRRILEVGLAARRARDLWRRIRFVVDQARAWDEAGGGTLREYLAWAARQGAGTTRVSEAVLPETDDDSARIMTIHAAKGLEFPIAIVSGTTTQMRGRHSGVAVKWPPSGEVGIKLRQTTNTAFDDFQPIDEQMDRAERLRLLYVACTRARDHLVVSLHRSAADTKNARTAAAVLAAASDGLDHVELEPQGAPAKADDGSDMGVPPSEPLPYEVWREEYERTLAASERSRSVAATTLAREASAAAAAAEVAADHGLDEAPGFDKEPRDLDLPPWAKGRYGTAVGRAVHGALQTIDLSTGEGLDAAVRAQAQAEAVTDRLGVIADLTRSALGAPVVQVAARSDYWRETYVAAPFGDTILEGYLDLLYRDAAGLVIVDYKTDAWTTRADLDAKVARYRLQGAAYALMVQEATGEAVSRCVFAFLSRDTAVERDVDDLPGAIAEVEALLVHRPDSFQPAML